MKKDLLFINEIEMGRMAIATVKADEVILAQPVKIGYDLWLVVRQGRIRLASDFVVTDIGAQSFSVFAGGRIMEVLALSADFEADVFILSEKFQNELRIKEFVHLKMRFNTHPTLYLSPESMEALADYHRMAQRIISLRDNPYKWDSLLNLTKAFYYGGGYYFFQGLNHPEDAVLTGFLTLVEKNAASHHDIGFYADRLCLTPKYLSKLIKRKTGQTAKETIANHLLFRARTMLLNSDYSIQQISDALGFPSQSVFGKFFKKGMGVSPREYRLKR